MIRHIYVHDHRRKVRDGKLSPEDIAEIKAEKRRKGWSEAQIKEYIKEQESKTADALTVTYAQLKEKIKQGKWEAQTDLRKSGNTWGTQEIRVVGTGKVMQVRVEEIPTGVGDAIGGVTWSDIEAAQRGLNMVGMSLLDLDDLVREHQGKEVFASKVIVTAAKQMIAAKKRAGARDIAGPHSIVTVSSASATLGRGVLIVKVKNGEKFLVRASETGGATPKIGETLDPSKHERYSA